MLDLYHREGQAAQERAEAGMVLCGTSRGLRYG